MIHKSRVEELKRRVLWLEKVNKALFKHIKKLEKGKK